ncbi:rhodanese-like domain-containing protein [Sphingobium subterraneum]|uniref:rhodanese-like domain-containing protein n=1 Tax=Sphingobium subterraneum TaxID=627688 RepID=UPI003CCD1868
MVSLAELDRLTASEQGILIDLATSREHRKGHIPGARFALPIELEQLLLEKAGEEPVVLTSPDGRLARLVAARYRERQTVSALELGTAGWSGAGRPLATGLENPLSEPRDIYKRPYEGTDNASEAMQAYLDWEFGLVEQLRRDGTHGFFVI